MSGRELFNWQALIDQSLNQCMVYVSSEYSLQALPTHVW